MKRFQLASYSPDLPREASAGASVCKNVIPFQKLTQQNAPPIISYSPMPSPVVYSGGGLDGRCVGALTILDNSNNVYSFAADANKLYRLASGTLTFDDISNTGGYNTSPDDFWSFTAYKYRIIATNYADPIQTYVMGVSTTFDDLSADAPKARYATTIKNWVVVGNTNDPIDGPQPKRIWFSAIDNPTYWPEPGSDAAISVQSDFRDIIQDVGQIQGLVGGLANADGLIFCEHAVYRINYAGARTIFDLRIAAETRGTPAPNSIIKANDKVFYLGEDGFYAHDGLRVTAIGQGRVNKTFYRELDLSYISRVTGTADPIYPIIFWAYPGPGSNNGTANCMLIYNYAIDEWARAEGPVESNLEYLARSLSIGYTLETLDDTGFNMDNLPYSLDSRIWTSGKPLLACFTTDHKLAHFTGPPYPAEVETVEMSHPDSRRFAVTSSRAIVDGGLPSIAISTRENSEDTPLYKPEVPKNQWGISPQRASGRFIRGKILMPAGSAFGQISGLELDIKQEGSR